MSGNPLAVGFAAAIDVDRVAVANDWLQVPAPAPVVDQFPEQFHSRAEFEAWLTEAAVAQWGYLFGQSTNNPNPALHVLGYNPYVDDGLALRVDRLVAFDAPGANVATLVDSQFSSTNVQVEGVDEADLVETDGDYLYILSGSDLVIVSAGVGDALRVTARVHVDGHPVGMYLTGDRLTVVSSSQETPSNTNRPGIVFFAEDRSEYSDYASPTVTVTVFDVADRSAPTQVQKSQMDGQLIASRVVGGELRLVLGSSINLPAPIVKSADGTPAPPPYAVPIWNAPNWNGGGLMLRAFDADRYDPPGDETQYFYETQEEYLARIKDEIYRSATPSLRILDVDGSVLEERSLVEATDVYRPESAGDRTMTTIATFDLMGDVAGPVDTLSVMSGVTPQVYMSETSAYLFSDSGYSSNSVWLTNSSLASSTVIRKFDFDTVSHEVSFAARGRVSGNLLNQFAADEYNGDLRVVTTAWNSGQNLFVLRQDGNALEVIGEVHDIAAGERLHSVRFMGERAFVVTFRQVDPLFAIDLSDPENPAVLGELVIPGVSGYLQPLDATHLIGVGRAMDGSGWMFGDLEVSIFGVEDLMHPELLHKFSFEGGWSTNTPVLSASWIPFTGDAHAAAYFADAQIFAMPVYSTDGGSLDGVESTPVFEPGAGGLQVFRIDVDSGFTPLAFIQHDTLVERAVRVGDHLFAISSGEVTVHELADPSVELGSVAIGVDAGIPLTELARYQPILVATTLGVATEPDPAAAAPRVDRLPIGWAEEAPRRRSESARHRAFHEGGLGRADSRSLADELLRSGLRDATADHTRAGAKASVARHPVDEVFSAGENATPSSWKDGWTCRLADPLAEALAR
jgi:uncharacterized secreted protein with C-terminal beta-propeller domain